MGILVECLSNFSSQHMINLKVVTKDVSSTHDALGMCATSRSNVSDIVKVLISREHECGWIALQLNLLSLSTCDILTARPERRDLQPLLQ